MATGRSPNPKSPKLFFPHDAGQGGRVFLRVFKNCSNTVFLVAGGHRLDFTVRLRTQVLESQLPCCHVILRSNGLNLRQASARITSTVRTVMPVAGGELELVRTDTYVWLYGQGGTLISRPEGV